MESYPTVGWEEVLDLTIWAKMKKIVRGLTVGRKNVG
jgi:hypothetical protein